MSPVLEYLLSRTYTYTDLHRRLRLLQESLEEVIYDEPQQIRVVPIAERRQKAIKEKTLEESDAIVLNEMEEKLWEIFTPKTVVSEVKGLMVASDKLPVMTLYVPVFFTEVQLAPISEWARGQVEQNLLFEVLVDPKTVGGCAFVYKDTHFDWSLRRYLRAKRGMVTSLLNAYGD